MGDIQFEFKNSHSLWHTWDRAGSLHIDPIARLESFRALNISKLEEGNVLKPKDSNGGFSQPKTLKIGEDYGPTI